MQEKLKQLKNDFVGSKFIYQEAPHLEKKTYFGSKVSIVGDKFKIETDTRTFIVHQSDLKSFMEKVTFSGKVEVTEMIQKESNALGSKSVVKSVEIYIPEACSNVSDGLLAMFNKIQSGNATKTDLENAKSMSDIAGKLIDVEKVKLGYLSLSKR